MICSSCGGERPPLEPCGRCKRAKPARLDPAGTAEPLTKLVTHVRIGDRFGNVATDGINPEYVAEDGERIPLGDHKRIAWKYALRNMRHALLEAGVDNAKAEALSHGVSKAVDERIAALESRVRHLESREATIIKALNPADGGQYRADIVTKIEMLQAELSVETHRADNWMARCYDADIIGMQHYEIATAAESIVWRAVIERDEARAERDSARETITKIAIVTGECAETGTGFGPVVCEDWAIVESVETLVSELAALRAPDRGTLINREASASLALVDATSAYEEAQRKAPRLKKGPRAELMTKAEERLKKAAEEHAAAKAALIESEAK